MPDYVIKICREELLGLWHDFWDSGNPSELAKKANEDGSLGQTTIVNAKSLAEACSKAASENPGYAVIRDASHKIGR